MEYRAKQAHLFIKIIFFCYETTRRKKITTKLKFYLSTVHKKLSSDFFYIDIFFFTSINMRNVNGGHISV